MSHDFLTEAEPAWRDDLTSFAREMGSLAGEAFWPDVQTVAPIIANAIRAFGAAIPNKRKAFDYLIEQAKDAYEPLFEAGSALRERALDLLNAGAPAWRVEEESWGYQSVLPQHTILFHLRWAAHHAKPKASPPRARRRR